MKVAHAQGVGGSNITIHEMNANTNTNTNTNTNPFQHALWAHNYQGIFPFFKNPMYFRNVWKQFLAYQLFGTNGTSSSSDQEKVKYNLTCLALLCQEDGTHANIIVLREIHMESYSTLAHAMHLFSLTSRDWISTNYMTFHILRTW
jgi:hypothetical protein